MLIETERRGQHVVLTLNRPEKLNALSYALIDELMDRLDALERDDSVRCLVLTGQGNRAFSAGADIAGFAPDIAASPEHTRGNFVARGQAMTRRIENYPKPVIAAINGIAFGGGCETMEACSPLVTASRKLTSWRSLPEACITSAMVIRLISVTRMPQLAQHQDQNIRLGVARCGAGDFDKPGELPCIQPQGALFFCHFLYLWNSFKLMNYRERNRQLLFR